MAEALIRAGAEIDAVVQLVKPFGLLVRTGTGVPGLVRGASAETGATIRVRVLEFDSDALRFSAALAG
ncbi:hypothetical protein ACWDSJ_35395 [Nocardia sp. NPDC003482]